MDAKQVIDFYVKKEVSPSSDYHQTYCQDYRDFHILIFFAISLHPYSLQWLLAAVIISMFFLWRSYWW